jgi:NAD(P)-dependent dehydrogenase (short-subunit alcohol dehydrogenase family)
MSERLTGRVAVVTGGANGIGRVCCERLAGEGANVVIADLADTGAAVAAVEATGARAVPVKADAASEADNEALMALAVGEFGRLDILITAAGVSHAEYQSGEGAADAELVLERLAAAGDPAQQFAELTLGDWQRVIDINLTGSYLALRAASRHVLAAGRPASFITLASIAAKDPAAGPLPYAVSKSGVWMLTKHAARSLGPRGIRVNAIGPGFIETNMTAIFGHIPGAREMIMTQIPLGRMGEPADVADLAAFLASDDSSYITGQLIHPDGGWFTG